MFKTRIAIFTEQGQELIVVPLDSSFQDRLPSQRLEALRMLQNSAINAGLTAPIAVVWRVGCKHYFIAPEQWHPFLKTLSWDTIIFKLGAALKCYDESIGTHRGGYEPL